MNSLLDLLCENASKSFKRLNYWQGISYKDYAPLKTVIPATTVSEEEEVEIGKSDLKGSCKASI